MKTKFLFLVAAFVLFSSLLTVAKAQVNVGDSLALVDLYNSTNGPHWNHNDNWLTKKPVSTWYGVYLNNNKVTYIALPDNHLTGEIPASIGNFDSLTEINFYYSKLRGQIPASIGKLKTLQELELSFNKLVGNIPAAIEKLSLLTDLDLGSNKFTGTIPDSLAKCTSLIYLNLSYNKLTGTIPVSFKKFIQLRELILSGNQLGPTLEDVFSEGATLTDLELSLNNYSGIIPVFLSRFPNLSILDLSQNQFSGTIPAGFGKLRQLSRLYLSDNQLTGSVPALSPDINILSLYNNQLTSNSNPQYSGQQNNTGYASLEYNRFTFSGLEYFAKKYLFVTYKPQAKLAVHYYENGLAVSAGGTLSNNTYTWFKVGKGGVFRTTGDSTFQPSQSGQYYAQIKNAVVTNLTLTTDTIAYTLPVANNELNISLSPNPARDIISIHGLNENSNAKITIADMSGYVWMTAMSRQQSAIRFDVSRLKAGNYLVNVNDGKEVKTIQFVKE